MNRTISPGTRFGTVRIPASKSQAHRIFIAAALSESETIINCDGLSKDINATIKCLEALGACVIQESETAFRVKPIGTAAIEADMYCGESGSTLRFMLPLVGALGHDSVFHREGRLAERPLEPLMSELVAHGMSFREDGVLLYTSGKLESGDFSLPGNISSQYITGLLMALPFIDGNSKLTITGTLESAAYISMTEQVLKSSGIEFEHLNNTYYIKGNQRCHLSHETTVEGDYSNAAFFLCMGALSAKGVSVKGLSENSLQGDKAVIDILQAFGAKADITCDSAKISRDDLTGITVDASPIPDLIPVLSVTACGCIGETRFINAGRLRLKESDRLVSTAQLINNLGGNAQINGDTLIVVGTGKLCGGTVDSFGDHRIAMSAAVASCICDGIVELLGSECVQKSYPRFWDDFDSLKGVES